IEVEIEITVTARTNVIITSDLHIISSSSESDVGKVSVRCAVVSLNAHIAYGVLPDEEIIDGQVPDKHRRICKISESDLAIHSSLRNRCVCLHETGERPQFKFAEA